MKPNHLAKLEQSLFNTLETILQYLPDTKYSFENGKLIIDDDLYLDSLTSCNKDFLRDATINGNLFLYPLISCDKDFLKDTTINGGLYLKSLKSCDKDFLKDTVINGNLSLDSLTSCDKDFLKDTVIKGDLSLDSLTSCNKDFLRDVTINGFLYLRSLTSPDQNIIRSNVSELEEGYNKEKSYCYFDGILSKVLKVSKKQGYTIYHTPFEYIIQKDNLTAHAKTIKQGIIDVKFKEYAKNLKHTKLKMDDEVSSELYRAITGACYNGMRNWMQNNGIEYIVEGSTVKNKNKLTLRDVYVFLEKTNPYGFDRFKELIEG